MVVTYSFFFFFLKNSKKYDVVGKDVDGLWPFEALAVAMLNKFVWVNEVLCVTTKINHLNRVRSHE